MNKKKLRRAAEQIMRETIRHMPAHLWASFPVIRSFLPSADQLEFSVTFDSENCVLTFRLQVGDRYTDFTATGSEIAPLVHVSLLARRFHEAAEFMCFDDFTIAELELGPA